MAAGVITKMVFSKEWGYKPEDVEVVGIMPCTLKKHETEFKMPNGLKYVDEVITTVELGELAKKKGLELDKVKPYAPSKLSMPSKDGVIFGASGGVSEAILDNIARMENKPLKVEDLREDKALRTYIAKIGNLEIKGAVVFGLPVAARLIKSPEFKELHLVEVMMCPFGCVGGPGQPSAPLETVKKRAQVMRQIADRNVNKYSKELGSLNSVKDYLESHYDYFVYDW